MVKYLRTTSLLLAGLMGGSTAFHGGNFARRVSNGVTRRAFALNAEQKLPIQCGEEVMSQKGHGTSAKPVQKKLRWGCDFETADRICNFNRHYAEFSGYWATTNYLNEIPRDEPSEYYDSVTGKLLFTAPVGRTMEDYIKESNNHGWPSFRDDEVNWEYVRCLPNGECVSVDGTHLGHNIPDKTGNRYCINLVSVAGESEA